MTDPTSAPTLTLTLKGGCSACNVAAQIAADGAMKVCPRCYAVLWHREDKAEAEAVARRLQALAERDRKRQERMTLHLASKERAEIDRLRAALEPKP